MRSLRSLVSRASSLPDRPAPRPPCVVEALEERRLLSVTLSASVGQGGVNRYADVVQVQQRLRDLNYRSKGGGTIVVDGAIGPATISAIKLYQASIDPTGEGDPDLKDGRVDVGGATNQWLNASNGPAWRKLVDPDGAGGTFDIYRGTAQTEVWATSWAVDTVLEATAASPGTEIITALSTVDGYGSAGVHATHQAGMDIDVNIAGPGRVIGSGSLSPGEREVVDDMKAFYNAAPPAFVARIIVGYTRIRNAFNAETGTSLAVYDSGNVHDTHFHVDLRPAVRSSTVYSNTAIASGPAKTSALTFAATPVATSALSFAATPVAASVFGDAPVDALPA